MKKLIHIAFLFCILSGFINAQTAKMVYLHDNWQFRKVGDEKWLPASVPGTIHTDLMSNNIIPDPYFRDNESKVQWIENENWEYRLEFNLDDNIYNKQVINLIFEGLDTYAIVYLNEERVLYANNMFRKWDVNCKKYLKKSGNELLIIFNSPVRVGDSIANSYYKTEAIKGLPGGNRVFTRKAAYHYGWDWGPRLVTSGIWRPVYLEAWDYFKIESAYVITKEVDNSNASLQAVLNVKSTETAELLTIITDKSSGKKLAYSTDKIIPGDNKIIINYTISNPELWWCNGLGEPHLYDFFIESTDNRERWNSVDINHGIRSIKLVQEKDSIGKSFYFLLNDVPVFIKGANYIPQDNFIPRVTKEKYETLIKDVKSCNMNMLRVWGGGIYEDDNFYEQCDKNGILIWQDFMFACAMNPGGDEFFDNVRIEADYNIERLINHPCIALWCGNNEADEGWKNWGWQKEFKYNKEQEKKI